MLRPREKDLTSLKEKVEHKRAQGKKVWGCMHVSYIRHIVVGKYDKSRPRLLKRWIALSIK